MIHVSKRKDGEEEDCNHSVDINQGLKRKPEKMLEIIQNNPRGKFIVFSDFCETFELIKPLLSKHGIAHTDLKGTKLQREQKLESFKMDDVSVIFLNSQFNGAGINLQVATDVILFHEVDPQVEIQTIARVNRMPRTGKPPTIHRLVFKKS